MAKPPPDRSRCLDVAPAAALPSGRALAVETGSGPVAIFNAGGHLFALDDSCIRCGASLAQGAVDGERVACAGCGWQYDLATGRVARVPALRTDTFAVAVSGARIVVETLPAVAR